MTDPWDEKPEPFFAKGRLYCYGIGSMDAWLEKLMRQQQEDKQILIDRINELEPKAEKWDRIVNADTFYNTLEKLEAIKTWYQHQLGNEVDPQDIRELGEILGAEV